MTIDETDRALIAALRRLPRSSLTEIATAIGVARGTVYSRLDRLTAAGVITGHGPDIDPRRAGFDVTAFATLEITQGTHDRTIEALSEIPEVLEIHTVTGIGDLLCKVVARSNDDLHDILLRITSVPSVRRCQTQLALQTNHQRHLAEVL